MAEDQQVATPVGSLELDGTELPVYDLGTFNQADVARVSSFSSNFGWWQVPPEVATALAMPASGRASLEWIHDTGELVLLGGVPTVGEVSVDVPASAAVADSVMPAFLGGTATSVGRDAAGNVREMFKSEVMPEGSRVALLAHLKHGPKVHELLWGWHREHRQAEGWRWLVDRLASLDGAAPDSDDHLA